MTRWPTGSSACRARYMMRPGSIPMDLFCMKSDYSDSSMTLNTGVAKLYNDVMLELGLLTPPQRYQLEQAGGDLNAVKVRQSIDGFPIDVFSAERGAGYGRLFSGIQICFPYPLNYV